MSAFQDKNVVLYLPQSADTSGAPIFANANAKHWKDLLPFFAQEHEMWYFVVLWTVQAHRPRRPNANQAQNLWQTWKFGNFILCHGRKHCTSLLAIVLLLCHAKVTVFVWKLKIVVEIHPQKIKRQLFCRVLILIRSSLVYGSSPLLFSRKLKGDGFCITRTPLLLLGCVVTILGNSYWFEILHKKQRQCIQNVRSFEVHQDIWCWKPLPSFPVSFRHQPTKLYYMYL